MAQSIPQIGAEVNGNKAKTTTESGNNEMATDVADGTNSREPGTLNLRVGDRE
jgi:hypothetical protein